jgi:glycosyltransferase involved in cell wall biosynthesis
MPRLLLLTPAALSADPRARRAADAALALGWDVTVLAVGDGVREAPVDLAIVHVHPGRATAALRQAHIGGPSGRQRPLIRELRGVFRLLRFTLLNIRLFRAGRQLGSFDIVHGNDFETLPAAAVLAKRSRARLVYDAHEIYSAQEPNPPRLYLAVSNQLERLLARRADSVITVSGPIAAELNVRLRLRRTPFVVLNCPALTDAPPETPVEPPLRVVYQGAVGPGRDIGDLFAAAAAAPNVHFSVRLAGADRSELERRVERLGLESRVAILEPVDASVLVSALAGFDVGLIINRPVTRNDELVLPNKLFEYLMAGLAVVTPRLPSLAALIDEESTGATFEPGDTHSFGAALEQLAAEPGEVAAMKQRARRAAVERYHAEAQRPALYAAWGL